MESMRGRPSALLRTSRVAGQQALHLGDEPSPLPGALVLGPALGHEQVYLPRFLLPQLVLQLGLYRRQQLLEWCRALPSIVNLATVIHHPSTSNTIASARSCMTSSAWSSRWSSARATALIRSSSR